MRHRVSHRRRRLWMAELLMRDISSSREMALAGRFEYFNDRNGLYSGTDAGAEGVYRDLRLQVWRGLSGTRLSSGGTGAMCRSS